MSSGIGDEVEDLLNKSITAQIEQNMPMPRPSYQHMVASRLNATKTPEGKMDILRERRGC
eukprot:CAMPEP_0172311054 /NCGR_PEP_ID=MMETSP1058-20130122/13658_1 /TAXON_ID=83371 /ORGANISM="Detonula confervacea, Strain CCMP 353" /LENGTH=59 /DNA_ID=CAMNT_0013024111 /DNA_START=137 /DNA_END=316 /DNA_ORIENTATION=-